MKNKPEWVKDAESMGLKWDDLSLFDKIQFQKRYPRGRQLLVTPIHIGSTFERLDNVPLKVRNER